MLMAAGGSFVVTIFGTPFLIRWLRAHGVGAQIRDDGPIEHPHIAKAGTPTMGGIAIVVAVVVGYLFAHIRRKSVAFTTSGYALLALIVGLGIVGYIDDWLGVRARRNLGLRKRGKTFGIVVIAAAFAWLAVSFVKTDTHLSFTQPLGLDFGKVGMLVWIVLVIYATTNAVNFTDGVDGLAAGSSALTFAAFMIIAFTEFRHPDIYRVLSAQALDQAVVAAAMFGACAGFLWWLGSQWFVGSENGYVTINQGIPQDLAGIPMNRVSTQTALPVASLPYYDQQQLALTIDAGTEAEAQRIVADLEKKAAACTAEPVPLGCPPSTSTSPTQPTPGASATSLLSRATASASPTR